MPGEAKHISSFDAALYGLKNDVLMMSSLTDRIFQTAFEALLKRDSELCDHVVAEDEEIDILEKQVDQQGVNLLLRFHPVASDMREVVSAMKVSANLERIADSTKPRWTLSLCQPMSTLSSLLAPWSGLEIMLRTLLRTLSGVNRPPIYAIPTGRKKTVNKIFLDRAKRAFAKSGAAALPKISGRAHKKKKRAAERGAALNLLFGTR